jgi:hypothetical protein
VSPVQADEGPVSEMDWPGGGGGMESGWKMETSSIVPYENIGKKRKNNMLKMRRFIIFVVRL